jgi:hypothetical protein
MDVDLFLCIKNASIGCCGVSFPIGKEKERDFNAVLIVVIINR